MHSVDVYLVIGAGDCNRIPVGTTLDSVPDVLEATREVVNSSLQQTYPALYTFTEFGLQAIESFMIAITNSAEYTAKIGVADLSGVPLLDRELAGTLAGNFVTALRIRRGPQEEAALKLLDTNYDDDWQNASFIVEPGRWLTRHILGDSPPSLEALKA
jgi:hypothetical protein